MGVKVKFSATRDRKSFLWSRGGRAESTYGGKSTTKVVGPKVLSDGDVVPDAPEWLADTMCSRYPDNFKIVGEKPKSAKSESSDEPKGSE